MRKTERIIELVKEALGHQIEINREVAWRLAITPIRFRKPTSNDNGGAK